MKEELGNLFTAGSCLNQRQLQDYVQDKLSAQERYAIEKHLNNCTLCSDAVEGMLWARDNHKQVSIPSMPTDLMAKATAIANEAKSARLAADAHKKQQLSQTIAQERLQPKIFSVSDQDRPKKSSKYLAAAATLLIMIAGGYGLIKLLDRSSSTENSAPMAANEKDIQLQLDSYIHSIPPSPEISSAQETFNERLKQSNNIPDTDNSPTSSSAVIEKKEVQTSPAGEVDKGEAQSPYAGIQNKDLEERTNDNNSKGSKEEINLQNSEREKVAMEKTAEKSISKTQAAPAAARNEETADVATSEKQWLNEGIRAYNEDKMTLAHRQLNKIISNSKSPYYNEARYYKALCYIKEGQNGKAQNILESLVDKGGAIGRKAKRALKGLE